MTVRWALIGAGRHPQLWLAPALQRAANAEIRGVWSRDVAHGRAFADRFGLSRVYDSIDSALADPVVDAVLIATPNALHARHAIAAFAAGKHVFCEKPMAVSVAEARAMVQAARKAERQLGIGFQLRHHQLLAEARRRIADGAIGEVIYLRGQFHRVSAPPNPVAIPHGAWKRDPDQMGGAGALMGLGVHVLDLLRFLTGREVAAVTAVTNGQTAEQPLESFAQVVLEFAGGAQGYAVYGGGFPLARNDVVIQGSQGQIVLDDVIDVTSQGVLHHTTPDGQGGTRTESIQLVLTDHYQRQFEAFGRAIETNGTFAADGIDGLRSVEIQTAVIESQRTGRRISLEHVEI